MTTVDADVQSGQGLHAAPVVEAAVPVESGDPALIGLPSFIVGSVALGLVLVGYVPAAAVGPRCP